MIDAAVRFLLENDDLMLIAHISPDGDTLGSSLALYCALVKMGKRVQVVCEDPVPATYRFCAHADAVLLPAQAVQASAVVTVDCADKQRTGAAAMFLDRAQRTLSIDHHGTNSGFAQQNWVLPVAAAGEMIYELLLRLPVEIDCEIASLLYMALATDTGNFSYSNTSPDTFRVAAALLEKGIDLPELNRKLFRTVPLRKLLLQSRAVAACRFFADERIAIARLTLEDLAACGAAGEDSEGLIDSLRDIETVEIAALLRECANGEIRVGLRGKRLADVSRIAARYGGGGHRLAAGCTMQGPLDVAADLIRAEAEKILLGGTD